MPPLLSAKACWRAGWVVIGLGIALIVASSSLASALLQGQGPDALAQILFTAVNVVAHLTPSAGVLLLIGSVIVRHVEQLTDALVASGTIEAPAISSRGPGRTPDGAVDLDDLDDADVVEHEPGVR